MSGKTILEDLLCEWLDIVFCGTAVGDTSARKGAYYAGPGNCFWRTLAECGITPSQLRPEEFSKLSAFRCGLTDLVKHRSGNDNELSQGDFDPVAFEQKIMRCSPHILAFTSKRAAREYLGRKVAYGLQPETIGTTRIVVLPSPSGAARRWWNIDPWRELTRMRNQLCTNATRVGA